MSVCISVYDQVLDMICVDGVVDRRLAMLGVITRTKWQG